MQFGCVVMASGMSARFGGNKLLADFRGAPLIECALGAIPEGLRTVVVTRSEAVARIAEGLGFEAVVHQLPHRADTIRLGLERMADVDGCLFLVGDQPLLRKQTIAAMLCEMEAYPDCILRARSGDRWGNPVLFPKRCFSALMSLAPGQTGGHVIRSGAVEAIPFEVAHEWELWDIDTREDLQKLDLQSAK